MTSTETLLARIQEHCDRHQIAESTFGRRSVNDGKLVARLRAGGSINLRTLERLEIALSAETAAAASDPEISPGSEAFSSHREAAA